ncbi:malto-oligosyltrehalose trehalohydrolase [Afifella sp. IM 167]|uniref:malto-oligosyltrehalose trehalohydrolase n=1 Tax=Afifella sp. IM 167 TaxID=2033586 RepID=UPI001CCEE801|nr:malto-oligosyltrehalose trehalohydrolase [Afifella sp. IM 167]
MTQRFSTETRWGARLLEEGGALFRLWAPAQQELTLRLAGADHAMQPKGDGWFEIAVPDAAAGADYQFVLSDGFAVPDPAARAQAGDVHGPSRLVDPGAHAWRASDWRGRPEEEVVIYELHVGTFSAEGDFAGVEKKLDMLKETGITAIELMPVAQFAGNRGWGYDGVLLYAPHPAYGGVEGLKRLVDACHRRGLMAILDVVYNHFGPDGNYLHMYAPDFFDKERQTPWGAGIRYDDPAVRDFFIDNAMMWLGEYQFDGLRFDAIDQIKGEGSETLLPEIARRARSAFPDRHLFLSSEDDRNIVWLHAREEAGRPALLTAEWNDDFHHAAHCAATGEREGYYTDYADDPVGHLMRILAEGFAYQGETSQHWNGPRGVASAGQPPTGFVTFLQNHDQVGNRADGERLGVLADPVMLRLLQGVHLLSPQLPLLFMGEEYGEENPFLFFTDFQGDLADAVREGRRREFKAWARFSDPQARAEIADPNDPQTFERSRLDWERADSARGRAMRDYVRELLAVRAREIVPRLAGMRAMNGEAERLADKAFRVAWRMGDGARMTMCANLGSGPAPTKGLSPAAPVFVSGPGVGAELRDGLVPPMSLTLLMEAAHG